MRLDIKYGLLAGAGICLWSYIEHLLGFDTTRLEIGEYSDYFSILILLGALYLLLRRLRNASSNGRLSIVPALWYGLISSTVAGLVLYVFRIAYDHLINPGWFEHVLAWKEASMRTAGDSETDIRDAMLRYRHLNTPVGILLSIVAGYMLSGAIISFLLAVILRRNPSPPPLPKA
ncbi:MAG: DUF4199 domain-containing protein [Opitutaceae bacterium]|nr:DUF4199 domain-containing protein [Opitutaceae bacterium]